MALGLTQPLTKMSTRNISWGVKVAGADLTTLMCRLSWNIEASTSCNPHGLSRPVIGLLYLLLQAIARILPQINTRFHNVTCALSTKSLQSGLLITSLKNHKYNKINTNFVIHTRFEPITLGSENSSASARSMVVELPT